VDINGEIIEAMILGGAVLGGGGGGSIAEGRRIGHAALELGRPWLVSIDELDDNDLLATVSAVGAPAAKERFVAPSDFIEATKLLLDHLDHGLSGFIASENGGTSTVHGLLQSAVLGVPVVDAPCNGRAHPTGVMGSMGLSSLPEYLSRQAAVGGNPESGRRLQLYVEAAVPAADALVRQAAVQAGGMVAVTRSPVPARYVREHGAPGAIVQAIQLGRILMKERIAGGRAVAGRLAAELRGDVIAAGEIAALELETRGGYDVGRLTVGDIELSFLNEYMTAEKQGQRVATFPDLITTLDYEDGTPRASAQLQPSARVLVLWAPRESLILGAGMRDPANFKPVEEILQRPILRYVFP